MKIAVVYNRESQNVINLFGVPNREKYGKRNIKRITDALKKGGHQVIALEGDKDLIDRLEEFMPRVLQGERPGMVFNLSYGIQGQARYTHVPGMLEMVGIPYVGSGPLAHSLALDKVVAKMIFRQRGLPTPDFVVLEEPGFDPPDMAYPLIVKPKNEAVSFGIKIVNDIDELREASQVIFDKFDQPVLAEQYIAGREINVGILGNSPPEALPPAELTFGGDGPAIYTYEDKMKKSGREVGIVCPAPLDPETTERAGKVAVGAFRALGCYDCARVDMRMDADNNLYILEINSLPSLGQHGSFPNAANAVGLDFDKLVNRLVEVAAARYFGTPEPAPVDAKARDPKALIFGYLTQRRDRIERRVKEWTNRSSRTGDPVGVGGATAEMESVLTELGLVREVNDSDGRTVQTWHTAAGGDGGTLLICHVDVPLQPDVAVQAFRRDPELLFGEGVASSRAPLVMLEYALRALKHARLLRRRKISVLFYSDEGRDCRFSADVIRRAAARADQVLVLRPGSSGDKVVIARRGQRKFRLTIESKPRRQGQVSKRPEVMLWLSEKLLAFSELNSRKDRVAVSAIDVKPRAFPMLLPHAATVTLLLTYPKRDVADAVESRLRELLGKTAGLTWSLEAESDRPPMADRRANAALVKRVRDVAESLEIPLETESSLWPSSAGLVPEETPVVCGIGPVGRDLHTPQEATPRISLMRRTMFLAQFLREA